ncbi:MAG: cupin domain-containing protein [Rikenellaceae bacterium]
MKTRSANFLLESELKWENPGPGITRQIMGYDGQIMLVKVLFEKGAIGTVHEHFHSQSTYVVSGKFETMINGEKKILQAGDGFYIEPDAPHGAVCLEPGILIDVFSPMREDFLK